VGLISGTDAFDRTIASSTLALLKKAGLEVVFNQEYSDRLPNFENILTLLKSRAPDALLWSGQELGAINYIRKSKSRNIGPKLFASFTTGVPSFTFRAALGKDANYAFGMTPWLPSEHLKDKWFGDASQFATAYENKFRYPPHYHVAAAVAAVESQALAMEAAGSLDPRMVRDALARLDFESIYGRIRFVKDGQVVMPLTVVQIQGEKLVEVFTDRFVNQPVYPIPPWDKR
jgi:branched-chain amino acid transport system substrate-binding protein